MEESDVVVLAGPNGSGKSSILELIGYALSNSWNLSWSLGRSFPEFSFEVEIAISKEEQNLIKESFEGSRIQFDQSAWSYLESNGTYYRGYNYPEGEYVKNAGTFNQVHGLVSQALKDYYSRSLGFFLKSDRGYPSRGFDQNRILQYQRQNQQKLLWNFSFNTSELQYGDMFDFLVQQRYHYLQELGFYQDKKDRGQEVGARPNDPMEQYNKLLQTLFPGYSFAQSESGIPTNLYVNIPSGESIPFSDLSGGEKETFFILAFFLRHDVRSAIIAIDEPELHLHPELARQLVRTMLSIRPANQIWIATHNGEIVDEAGRDKVLYVSRDAATRQATVIPSTDESTSSRMLKEIYGYSGYIGIAKKMVFLEGIDSSSDRKMFTRLFRTHGNQIKFIPSKSTGYLARINTAVLSILADEMGWINYYLIRDRDYLTDDLAQKLVEKSAGKLYVLKRNHIENYLLDDSIIASVQTDIFGKKTDNESVQRKLHATATTLSAEVVRDILEFRLNIIYGPQDFSLGKFMEKQAVIDGTGNPIDTAVSDFKRHVKAKISEVNTQMMTTTTDGAIDLIIRNAVEEVQKALNTDEWRNLFPGRRLLEAYGSKEGLGKPPAFVNSLIKDLASHPESIPSELSSLVNKIIDGNSLT
jgi:ABC-type lipoprotein export system ATPase subunit